jgi:hypothetical protein
VSVYCNGCKGSGAGPIAGSFVCPGLRLGGTDNGKGCRIRRRATMMSESTVTRVRSFDALIIFRDPRVSVSSMNTKAEPAANAANQSRVTENATTSCEDTAAKRGIRLVVNAPRLEICGRVCQHEVDKRGRSAGKRGEESSQGFRTATSTGR